MFDRLLIQKLNYIRKACARVLYRCKILPNQVTSVAFVIGLVGACFIAYARFSAGLVCIVLNRILDGLDGPLAQEMLRHKRAHNSVIGGYIDAVFDFIFYASIPAAFIIADPIANARAGAVIMLSFVLTCVSFLAFAAVKAPHAADTYSNTKSFPYSAGLAEGFETIIYFVLICLFPTQFSLFTWVFSAMCVYTGVVRIWRTIAALRRETEN